MENLIFKERKSIKWKCKMIKNNVQSPLNRNFVAFEFDYDYEMEEYDLIFIC